MMNNQATQTANELHGHNQMVDLTEQYSPGVTNEASYHGVPKLHRVRLSETPAVIALITGSAEAAHFHYLDTPSLRGYVSCNGEGCELCLAGFKRDVRLLLPVFNVIEQRVDILPISKAERPTSLLPQLKPLLNSSGQLISIRQTGVTFQVSAKPMPKGVTLDKKAIDNFKAKHEQGEIRFSDIYLMVDNEELASIPQVKTRLLINQAS